MALVSANMALPSILSPRSSFLNWTSAMDSSSTEPTVSFPSPIKFEDSLLSLDTHPSLPLISCGTADGRLHIYSIGDTNKMEVDLTLSRDSCRSLSFSKSGKSLYCGMKDQNLLHVDTETWQISNTTSVAHNCPLNKVYVMSERLIASGDEKGCVKIWDTRLKKEIFSVSENTDFISDIISSQEKQILLCTSGDGSLSAIDLRQKQLEQRSDCSESELLSIALVKNDSRVICGDSDGVLGIFTWGVWGDNTDRYPVSTKSNSIDSLTQLSDSVVCTGGMDGEIRAIQILPNKLICTIGAHSLDDSGFPVEHLKLLWRSHGGNEEEDQLLVSGSYDCVKFWSVSDIPKVWTKERSYVHYGDLNMKKGGKKRRRNRRRKEMIEGSRKNKEAKKDGDNFFEGLL